LKSVSPSIIQNCVTPLRHQPTEAIDRTAAALSLRLGEFFLAIPHRERKKRVDEVKGKK